LNNLLASLSNRKKPGFHYGKSGFFMRARAFFETTIKENCSILVPANEPLWTSKTDGHEAEPETVIRSLL